MKLTVLLLALLVGAFVLPCGAADTGAADDTSVDSVAVAPAPTPGGGAILPSATTLAPGTTAGTTTTNSSSGATSPSVTTAPSTVTTNPPVPAGTKVPQVTSTVSLTNFDIHTFNAAAQQAFVNAIRSALPPSANVLVAINKITASSVTVESSVTFLDGDTAAATAFANTLSSSPNTIFPTSTYGAVTVTGTVSTQSVVANAPAPAPSSASTSSIAMLALTGAVGAFCLAIVSL